MLHTSGEIPMKAKWIIFLVPVLLIITISGCKTEDSVVNPVDEINTGEADLSSFVVIGNSISAGFQSNSLYKSAQEYSYGNLLAGQVKTQFVQPLISDPGTGERIELISAEPFRPMINLNEGTPLMESYASAYNNLGVPGACVYDIVNTYNKGTSYSTIAGGSGNELFDLILRGKGTQFQQAKSLNPTFLVLWIGNNDILGYALSGGVSNYTPVTSFETYYRQLADSISTLNIDIIAGNIPDVTIIPYFTMVGAQLKLQGINSVWGITGEGDTTLMDTGKNYITLMAYIEEIYDISGEPTGRGLSKELPIRNKYILDEKEATAANEIVRDYNNIISAVTAEKGFILADFNQLFNNIKNSEGSGGYADGGIKFTTEYYYGNLFSLDGVHPSNMGSALIANELIRIINREFKASIPLIEISIISNNFLN
jgi:lysophospholipase L1-like esterase